MTTEIQINSISDFTNGVCLLYNMFNCDSGDIWYRGINKPKNTLVPGVVWRKLHEHEDSIVGEFLLKYRSYTDQIFNNKWELYALMQHYGLPTRLLDWTKSPLLGLFFSLYRPNGGRHRVVWAINPIALNVMSADRDYVVIPTDDKIADDNFSYYYLPKALRNRWNTPVPETPIAISAPYTNKRIIAQQGCFTVHGNNELDISEIFTNSKNKEIVRFVIKGEELRLELLEALFQMGIKEDFVFQDLNSLSDRILREFTRDIAIRPITCNMAGNC